jgi:hypothetical protein
MEVCVSRIPNLVSAACLATACLSCGTPEARTAREPAGSPANPFPMFQNAIMVRDEYTVALFARLIPGVKAPPTLPITLYDHGKVVDEIKAAVHGSGSGFVYAPQRLPVSATQKHISIADRAGIATGSGVSPMVLQDAAEVLPSLVPYGYPPCPDCLIYFLCHCLTTPESLLPCPPLDGGRTCPPVDR